MIPNDNIKLAFYNLCELAADLEDVSDEELVFLRSTMLGRVNECISLLNDDGYGDANETNN